jgi:hypothetical protein
MCFMTFWLEMASLRFRHDTHLVGGSGILPAEGLVRPWRFAENPDGAKAEPMIYGS